MPAKKKSNRKKKSKLTKRAKADLDMKILMDANKPRGAFALPGLGRKKKK